MHFNPLDWLLLAVFVLAVWDGGRRGFVPYATELAAFAASVGAAFVLFEPVGSAVSALLHVPSALAGFGCFLLVVVAGHGLVQPAIHRWALFLHRHLIAGRRPQVARVAGILPATGGAAVVAWVGLGILVVLPSTDSLRPLITSSSVASILARSSTVLPLKALLVAAPPATHVPAAAPSPAGGDDTFYHLSYPPGIQLQLDPAAEDRMLLLLNQTRADHGLPLLVMDTTLRQVARDHSRDMYLRGYFSHTTPDHQTPFDRMRKAGVSFVTAGENIALAPQVDQAEASLMASPGHRANILDPDFQRVGIGVWKGLGGYEEMFTQDFADLG